jgi:hypothetical protein
MVVERSTTGSYFMACGWNTGYFGIQELEENGKVAIFSVWDPVSGDDPSAVSAEQRVEVLHQDAAVRIKRFGGEGTGGQCMMDFAWAIGQTNRFLVASKAEGDRTAYAGYLFMPTTGSWKHLVTFRTRTGGSPLKGFYSFVEDFRRDGRSVHDTRTAKFANGWVRTTGGEWLALTRARFTASGAEWESKENINATVQNREFRLFTGGPTKQTTALGSVLECSPIKVGLPEDLP